MKALLSLTLLLSLVVPRVSCAQAAKEDDLIASTQNDILLVAGAGVGGAVLGLSTLSFYDKPSRHLANIWTGAAIGIIAGVVVVALMHAQKSQDDLTGSVRPSSPDFATGERELWHVAQVEKNSALSGNLPQAAWSFSF